RQIIIYRLWSMKTPSEKCPNFVVQNTIIESRDTNTYTNSRYLMWVDLSILGKTEKWGKAL
ncbi:hypothetical protein AB7W58_14375, partial [Providencia rettgeri]